MIVSLSLSTESVKRLSRLKKKAGTDDNAEVMRNALRLYEWLIEQTEQGYDIALLRDGHMVKDVKIFV